MNKDLRKVVILLAHPNMKESQANKALIEAVSDIEGVAVFNLYDQQDAAFDVDEWSKIISDASALIYQFPFHWMAAPSLLKRWQDEVFTFLSKTPAVAAIDYSDHHRFRIRSIPQWRQEPLHNRRASTPLSSERHSFGDVLANTYCCLWNGNRRCGKEHRRRS